MRERHGGRHAASRGADQRVRVGAAHAEGAGASGGREARRSRRGRALARHGRAQAAARTPVAQRGGHVRVEVPQSQDGRAGALIQRGGRHEHACRPVQAQDASPAARFDLAAFFDRVCNLHAAGAYGQRCSTITCSATSKVSIHTCRMIGPSALLLQRNASLQECLFRVSMCASLHHL